MRNRDIWFSPRTPGHPARLRLYCFPYAGGSASAYRQFQAGLGNRVEVCAVELPGRAARLREPARRDFDELTNELLSLLRGELHRPYALFGYSMGALLAFELARAASAQGMAPAHLFVAARAAPDTHTGRVKLSQLPDDQLLLEIERRYRSIPDILLADPEMRAIVVNLMRADLALIESYRFAPAPHLECPMTAFGGESDPGVLVPALDGWRERSSGRFRLETFPGDHFFMEAQRTSLLRSVLRDLRPHLEPRYEPHAP